MSKVTFSTGIASVWGAIDSVKDGQQNRRRMVVRRHNYGEGKNFDSDGCKWHQMFYYHFHKGAWSEGATRNREMIKAAQRTAHDIEHICGHPEAYAPEWVGEAERWIARYAAYRAALPPDSKRYYHFYNFVYTTILRSIREGQ